MHVFPHNCNLNAYNFVFWYKVVTEIFLSSFSYFLDELPGIWGNIFRVRPERLLTLGLQFSDCFWLTVVKHQLVLRARMIPTSG